MTRHLEHSQELSEDTTIRVYFASKGPFGTEYMKAHKKVMYGLWEKSTPLIFFVTVDIKNRF